MTSRLDQAETERGDVSEAELVEAVARDRAAGRTIAFANGCFDLLHVGHVRYLQGAAAEADRLIVAVNDDRSVAALKGAGPSDPAGGRSRGARRRAARRRLRRRLRRRDRRAAAAAAQARRALQRHRLHRRHGARARGRRRRTAAAPRSSAIPSSHATRDLLARGSPDRRPTTDDQRPVTPLPDRPARRARRHRARDSGRGGAAPRVSRGAHRLAGQRASTARSSISCR